MTFPASRRASAFRRPIQALIPVVFTLLLAGCSGPDPPANGVAKEFGEENVATRGGNATIRGEVLEGNVGTGWGPRPNLTVDAPRLDQSSKTVDRPGGGTSAALRMPPVDVPLQVRFKEAHKLVGFTVEWGMYAPGEDPSWGAPAAADGTTTLELARPGSTFVVARITDPNGHVAVTSEPLQAMVNVRWTVDSVVWPLSPTPTFIRCVDNVPGTYACVWSTPYGLVVCAVLCVASPAPLPYVRPPGYEEMADAFALTIPEAQVRLDVETRYRGEPSPTSGTNVDLELLASEESVVCVGDEFKSPQALGGPSVPSPDQASQSFGYHAGAGSFTIRVGGIGCPMFGTMNHGPVPYTMTATLAFGARPPEPPPEHRPQLE